MSAPYRQVDVHKIPMAGPADVSGLVKLMDEGRLDPRTIVAILGKTEGNGLVNDFTRGYLVLSLRRAPRRAVARGR